MFSMVFCALPGQIIPQICPRQVALSDSYVYIHCLVLLPRLSFPQALPSEEFALQPSEAVLDPDAALTGRFIWGTEMAFQWDWSVVPFLSAVWKHSFVPWRENKQTKKQTREQESGPEHFRYQTLFSISFQFLKFLFPNTTAFLVHPWELGMCTHSNEPSSF